MLALFTAVGILLPRFLNLASYAAHRPVDEQQGSRGIVRPMLLCFNHNRVMPPFAFSKSIPTYAIGVGPFAIMLSTGLVGRLPAERDVNWRCSTSGQYSDSITARAG
jgi:hypothetical protein